jgi:hypothetical protein
MDHLWINHNMVPSSLNFLLHLVCTWSCTFWTSLHHQVYESNNFFGSTQFCLTKIWSGSGKISWLLLKPSYEYFVVCLMNSSMQFKIWIFLCCLLPKFGNHRGCNILLIFFLSFIHSWFVLTLFLKQFIAHKIQQDTQGYKIVPLTNVL